MVDTFFPGSMFTSNLFEKKKKGHFPSVVEREAWDKCLFVYRYNQGGESLRRDNWGKPYPSLASIRARMSTSKY